ncbi:MAG TPA: DUF2474 domain-containing protein [Methylophilaceae bacterium]|nr:DUF2474 domain-containing protein [Methylophilaceae bacterium]
MSEPELPWWKKLLWLIALWSVSVAALGLVAYGMKFLMRSAGLSN